MFRVGIITVLLVLGCVECFPDTRNPNADYELINVADLTKPHLDNITPNPILINTPPPVDPNSKTFAFDPKSKSWTLVKKGDPPPNEDTLLWNQSNDKWLTQIARF